MGFSAFNDNFYKNALVILITYVLANSLSMSAEILISLAAACFIVPYFLFSGVAGMLADKFAKHRLARWLKLTELLLVLTASVALLSHDAAFMLFILFLLGTQSTFFSPVKYAVLPELLEKHELLRGNGMIEAGTFISILLGTSLGGLLILQPNGVYAVSAIMIASSFIGIWAAWRMPPTEAAVPGLRIPYNPFAGIASLVRAVASHRVILLPIIGISWFWAIGATYLIQIPVLTKEVIGGNEQVVTWFMALFSIGIAVGSLLCPWVTRKVRLYHSAPLSLLGMTLFGVDIVWLAHLTTPAEPLMGLDDYLQSIGHWRFTADLFGMAMCGGVFVIPLYTRLQTGSGTTQRARAIAGNNVMNALFMAVAAVAAALMYALGWQVREVLLTFALLNLPVVALLWRRR